MGIKRYTKAFDRLWKQFDDISDEYGTNKLFLVVHFLYCFIIYGSTPNDYIHFEFYKLRHCERKKFITMRKAYWLEKKLNNPQNAIYFNNKKEFNKKFRDFVKRDWIYLNDTSKKDFIEFCKKHKSVIVKPIALSSGRGIEIYNFNTEIDCENYYNDIKDKEILIEEVAKNHKDISKFNEDSTNTIRIYTIVNRDKSVDIVGAFIRVGAKGSCVDNYHSGGVGAAIDINTGIIYTQLIDVNNKRFIVHPTTKSEIIGNKIPNWKELIENVKKAALIFPDSRYIGWDICVTSNGFEYIEGNYDSDPGFLQSIDKVGKYILIKSKI